MTPIPVQLGLFGGENVLVGLHVVTAHTRLLGDGQEVFVGEHLRWNRGRTRPRPAPPGATGSASSPAGSDEDPQIPLFLAPGS